MYDISKFTVAFPEPTTPAEEQSFEDSLAIQAMTFFGNATTDWIDRMTKIKRKINGQAVPVRIALRLQTADLFGLGVYAIWDQLGQKQAAAVRNGSKVVALFVGNELDDGLDFRWHGPLGQPTSWGNEHVGAWDAQSEMQKRAHPSTFVVHWLNNPGPARQPLGVPLIFPAVTMRPSSEDDAPLPGLFAWREEVILPIQEYADGFGVHYYDNGWWERDNVSATQANVDRYKQAVRFWSGYYHKPIYIDETNTFRSAYTPEQHMEGIVGKSRLLLYGGSGDGYKLGERVEMLAGFAMNGLANDYPAQYIMRSPGCWGQIREHMLEEGVSAW